MRRYILGGSASVAPEQYGDADLGCNVNAAVVQKPGYAQSNSFEANGSFTPDYRQAQQDDDGDDLNIMQILFQFIPYYGQGDPSNDSTVRAALSSLSIEDIDSRDEYGNTLLLLACQYRCEDLVRIMLNKGADANATNSAGACCLHFACYGEGASIKICKWLLQNGANPEVCETAYGCTPLHYCASTGNIDLCKLLLSHGAQINTQDYYSYTCVDYAREAGMNDCAAYLQQRLDKSMIQNHFKLGIAGSPQNSVRFYGGGNNMVLHRPTTGVDGATNNGDWTPMIDPNSGSPYYCNSLTGEALWEYDWKVRMAQEVSSQPKEENGTKNVPDITPEKSFRQRLSEKFAPSKKGKQSSSSSNDVTPTKNDSWLVGQATKTRLVAFFGKHDPSRLPEMDSLLKKYEGREQDLLKELCAQYNVSEDPEFATFQSKLNELKNDNNLTENNTLTPPSLIPRGLSLAVNDAASSASAFMSSTFQARPGTSAATRPPGTPSNRGSSNNLITPDIAAMQGLVNDERAKWEAVLNEERNKFRDTISDKEGALAKLEADLDACRREKDAIQNELESVFSKLSRLQLQGGEAVSKFESDMQTSSLEREHLKKELADTKDELVVRTDQVKSLEGTLASLTAGNEERIAMEKSAAQQREIQHREREAAHREAILRVEQEKKAIEAAAKADIAKMKQHFKECEDELQAKHDQVKRAKDIEIESLNRELAERKTAFAKELSAAQILAEQSKKVADDAIARADAAEELQRSMQNEVEEARIVQSLNAQLHKDLAREQMARKRLHNEMEDMKGKIRVYVRVRPISKSELEKGCTEATSKDGKLSVVVKGANSDGSKKTFDFDQVFGGAEGNGQADVFRDTKHLVMSVLDGYNICIFAYGQTGAGKSYTMIGASDIGSCLRENGEFDETAGITPRAVSELFRLLNERNAQMTYEVDVQMFQLYRDNIDDLLYERKKKKKGEDEPPPPQMKIVLAEHSSTGLVQVDGAEVVAAQTPGDVMRIFAKGSARRVTTSTQMNAESSRSHLICSLVVKMTNRRSGVVTCGKMTLVDLAGSERVDKSGAMGEVLKEAQSINKSLSALGDVISALTSGQQHIPYRNHPLTMLMSDSVGGNSKTIVFINASPADYNVSETVSSLSFGVRCKDITNSVQAGPGVQAAQMNALKKELAKLKKTGTGAAKGSGGLVRPL